MTRHLASLKESRSLPPFTHTSLNFFTLTFIALGGASPESARSYGSGDGATTMGPSTEVTRGALPPRWVEHCPITSKNTSANPTRSEVFTVSRRRGGTLPTRHHSSISAYREGERPKVLEATGSSSTHNTQLSPAQASTAPGDVQPFHTQN